MYCAPCDDVASDGKIAAAVAAAAADDIDGACPVECGAEATACRSAKRIVDGAVCRLDSISAKLGNRIPVDGGGLASDVDPAPADDDDDAVGAGGRGWFELIFFFDKLMFCCYICNVFQHCPRLDIF